MSENLSNVILRLLKNADEKNQVLENRVVQQEIDIKDLKEKTKNLPTEI